MASPPARTRRRDPLEPPKASSSIFALTDEQGLHHGDNLPFMCALPEGSFTLIYADPPFCTGTVRRGRREEGLFDDVWPGGLKGYLDFLRPRIRQMHRLLAGNGTLYVHVDWRVSHHLRLMLDDIFGAGNFLNEIIWSYRTGGRGRRWFARKHDTLLAYARHLGRHVFHVLRGGRFRTEGLHRDEQGRPFKTTRQGRLYFHHEGPAMTDVWEIPFLSTVSRERTGYPAQKPEALLERVILASSRPGDLVGDFFCGSGTTLVTAARLGRRWVGCDHSAEAIMITRRRLELIQDRLTPRDSDRQAASGSFGSHGHGSA